MSRINFKKDILTVPNAISVARILMVVPCIYFFLQDDLLSASLLILLSGLSDAFDGFAARRLNQITKLGAMLDPVADKFTTIAVVVCLSLKFSDIIPIAIILVFKEIFMLVAGLYLINKGLTIPPAKWYGKVATTLFYVSVIVIVGLRAFFNFNNQYLTLSLLGVTTFMMIYAYFRYILVCLNLIRKSKKNIE